MGRFREPAAFERVEGGQYYVFDRLGHAVYGVDAELSTSWKIVQIGQEAGRIIEPSAFAISPNGSFVVADRPGGLERVQFFDQKGGLLGGFTLPGKPLEAVVLGDQVMSGVGCLAYNGRTLLISQPETGALVTEYSRTGGALRTFGLPRPTGQEARREIHQALNSVVPLFNPQGGFYAVFQTGVPIVRKYDQSGTLVFERHVEGTELDRILQNLPNRWPTREERGRAIPLIAPTVRAAAVDRVGRVWISFTSSPVVYVYDANGEKTRVVELQGAGVVSPGHMFFAADGRLLVTPGCYEFEV